MQNEIARAGLGLELEGGATIINDLRTIHSLMSGIISLAGSIPKGVSGVFEGPTSSSQRQTKQGFDTHVQQFKAMEKSKTQILETEARERKKIQDREDKDNRQAERDRKRRLIGPKLKRLVGPKHDADARKNLTVWTSTNRNVTVGAE
jgi:hypothetical protein